MKTFLLFFICLFTCYSQCDLTIDNFNIKSYTIAILLSSNPSFPIVESNYVQGISNDIIGGERDLEVSVSNGDINLILTTSIYNGQYTCSIPNQQHANSKTVLQYDGADASMNLNPSGLEGLNFYTYGSSIFFVAEADLGTNITINIFSGNNISFCTYTLHVEEYNINQNINFSSFSYIGSGCDFSNVGAVELIISMIDNSDLIISNFTIKSPSSSPTPSTLLNNQSFPNIIDDFTIETPLIVLIVPPNPVFPLNNSQCTQGSTSNILGGERDLQLTVSEANANLVLTAGVAAGYFTCSTPKYAFGENVLQYDGIDGSMKLNPSGLGGLNFYEYGNAFRILIETDVPTTITINVYSASPHDYCYININTTGDENNNEYLLNFSSFNYYGFGCFFSSVGAIEVYIDMSFNVDVLIGEFEIYTIVPTPSPLPSNYPYYSSAAEDIDTFQTEMSPVVVTIPVSPLFPINYYRNTRTYLEDIIGGERDLELSVFSGSTNTIFATSVYSGIFSCYSPLGGTGQVTIQWDGYDNSMNLNPSGLFGIELKEDGNKFSTIISSNTNTNMIIYVYSGYINDYCYYNTSIPSSLGIQYDFYFSSFNYNNGGCSFYNVGAIEIVIEMAENLDFKMDSFTVTNTTT